jgi:glycosyltransferase involved in cell wall biosynthesis
MKLHYIANVRLPTEKAHGIQIMAMCHAFSRLGVEVNLIIPRRFNPTLADEDAFKFYTIPPCFTITRLPTFDLTRYGKLLGALPHLVQKWSFSRKALVYCKKHPADIYYHRDEFTFPAFVREKMRSAWEIHTVPHRPQRYTKALTQSAGGVAITKAICEAFINTDVPKQKIYVAPDGVDVQKFRNIPSKEACRNILGIDNNATIVLYTGQLFPWKGVDTLIEAAKELPPDIHTIIVGGYGNDLTRLKQKASGSAIQFTGQVRHDMVLTYIGAADIVVIPNTARENISFKYTSPLKLFEAMAAGKAIIASDIPSLREILDDTTALLVPADNSKALRAAIVKLAYNKDLQQKLARAAQEESNQYDWQQRAKSILDFIIKNA